MLTVCIPSPPLGLIPSALSRTYPLSRTHPWPRDDVVFEVLRGVTLALPACNNINGLLRSPPSTIADHRWPHVLRNPLQLQRRSFYVRRVDSSAASTFAHLCACARSRAVCALARKIAFSVILYLRVNHV